jgi:hypothetical protein
MNPQQTDNMRPTRFPRLRQSCLLVAGALLLAHSSIHAQTFAYTNCDLVAGFRLPGASSDLVVNLGAVATFENFPLRSVIMITNLSVVQLSIRRKQLKCLGFAIPLLATNIPSQTQRQIH